MTDRYPAELNTVARLKIGVGGVVTSARRWLDLVAGTGVTLTPVDDGVNEKVSVTVAVTGAPPTGSAGGDLTGTYPNPTIGAGKVVTASILDANVTLAKLAAEAWTAWVPTITSQSGTITTVGAITARAAKIGRVVVFVANIAITTNGTGASGLNFTLPYNNNNTGNCFGSGRNETSGAMVTVTTNGATKGIIYKYDGAYPVADGQNIGVFGTYESTT